ncbi:MAG TPA: HDIG domain-containing protein [Methanomassiliicoccales archaeon]|nr:HDIG domain-containing protein [Methanomassiliicoccales archaeon]
MLGRQASLDLVRLHVQKENNIKHMIAVGAVMRSLAGRLGQDAELWEAVGILHDIDFEKCTGMGDHTLIARGILTGKVDFPVIEAIMAHNYEATGVPVDNQLKRGLITSDAVSGLVIACALVMPSRKLADVKVESVIKKFGNKDFARGCDRNRIASCSELDLELNEFLGIALEGMRVRAEELGL